MSIIESKSIKVAPALEQEIIDKHEMFGWTMTNSQEIHSQVGHTDSDAVFVYHTTTTTNYVKLQFQREKDFPNRERILKLEKEYWACFDTYMSSPRFMPGKIFWIIAIPTAGVGLLVALLNRSDVSAVLSCVPLILLGIAPMVMRHFFHYLPKKKEADRCLNRACEIEEEMGRSGEE